MTMIPSFGNRHNVFYIRTTEPDTPRVDDLWFDAGNRQVNIWDGEAWVRYTEIPSGGTTGQVHTKLSDDDYAVGWTTLP